MEEREEETEVGGVSFPNFLSAQVGSFLPPRDELLAGGLPRRCRAQVWGPQPASAAPGLGQRRLRAHTTGLGGSPARVLFS